MALVKCKECGKEISNKAGTCIHCGSPVNRDLEHKAERKEEKVKGNGKKVLIIILVVLLAALLLSLALLIPSEPLESDRVIGLWEQGVADSQYAKLLWLNDNGEFVEYGEESGLRRGTYEHEVTYMMSTDYKGSGIGHVVEKGWIHLAYQEQDDSPDKKLEYNVSYLYSNGREEFYLTDTQLEDSQLYYDITYFDEPVSLNKMLEKINIRIDKLVEKK